MAVKFSCLGVRYTKYSHGKSFPLLSFKNSHDSVNMDHRNLLLSSLLLINKELFIYTGLQCAYNICSKLFFSHISTLPLLINNLSCLHCFLYLIQSHSLSLPFTRLPSGNHFRTVLRGRFTPFL